ncbi:hypothetical protein D3C72_1877790 [compost metagenome]
MQILVVNADRVIKQLPQLLDSQDCIFARIEIPVPELLDRKPASWKTLIEQTI